MLWHYVEMSGWCRSCTLCVPLEWPDVEFPGSTLMIFAQYFSSTTLVWTEKCLLSFLVVTVPCVHRTSVRYCWSSGKICLPSRSLWLWEVYMRQVNACAILNTLLSLYLGGFQMNLLLTTWCCPMFSRIPLQHFLFFTICPQFYLSRFHTDSWFSFNTAFYFIESIMFLLCFDSCFLS